MRLEVLQEIGVGGKSPFRMAALLGPVEIGGTLTPAQWESINQWSILSTFLPLTTLSNQVWCVSYPKGEYE